MKVCGKNRNDDKARFVIKKANDKEFRQRILLCGLTAAVCIATVTAHWPALSCRALSLDDSEYIIGNPLVENPGWSSVNRIVAEVTKPSTVAGSYIPLTMLSQMLDYAMGGRMNNLRPFHRTSLILHVANTALVILLMYEIFGGIWPAAIAGLLFGIHPLTVGRITWVADRKTALGAFFALWCLLLYVRYTHKQFRWRLGVSLLMYALSLLSKPSGLPLPAVMLLLDYWPLGRLNWRAIREKALFFTVGAASFIISYISFEHTAPIVSMSQTGFSKIPLIVCYNIIFYLYKIIWPVNLTVFYPFPKPMSLSHPMVLTGVVGSCALITALLISWRWTRAFVTGWLIFFAAIFPTMGVIGFTDAIAGDRFLYLPSVGYLLILSWILNKVWDSEQVKDLLRPRRIITLAAVAIVSVLEITGTRAYLVYWRDTETHRKYVSKLAPDSAQIHEFAGLALVKEGKNEEAEYHFKEAVRLESRYYRPYVNLGVMLAQRGELDEAIKHFKMALLLKPDNDEAHHNLGHALYSKGDIDGAIKHYRESIRLVPDSPKTLGALAWALATSSSAEYRNGAEAVELAKKSCELTKYKEPELLNVLAAAYAQNGQFKEAARTIETAIDLYVSSGNIQRAGELAELQKLYRTGQRYPVNQ